MREDHTFWHRYPTRTGWWWCIPDELSTWHRRHPDGCVVYVHLQSGDVYAEAALSEKRVSLDPQTEHGLFGSWHGPLESPGGDPRNLIIDAEFEIVDDLSEG
ncbi:MAG: hypothetical protein AAF491_00010 [Verrucomicrobiota bacterium]